MDADTQELFSSSPCYRPLADRLRPIRIEEFVGQSHLLAKGKPLYQAICQGHIHSMILWGPPGTGKTTLAKLVAKSVNSHFLSISAVLSGVKDIRAAIDIAKQQQAESGQSTLLFVDEVHRFNKAQQDAFLPHIESGVIQFIGATTENPAFELNNALLSRARVYVLRSLSTKELAQVITRAVACLNKEFNNESNRESKGESSSALAVPVDVIEHIAERADGDARQALNLLETASDLAEPQEGQGPILTIKLINEVSGRRTRRFDKQGDLFYDMTSALHKSIRGSDPNAALYWFACLLDGGCDPLYIARRLVRIASEDIGNADPRALSLALDAWEVQQRLGSPEGELALAQAVTYLACASKSNAVYSAFKQALADAKQYGTQEVPNHLRNAPTTLAKSLGHSDHYRYAHDEPEGYAAGENYMPEELRDKVYYHPVPRGLETKISERLQYLAKLDQHYKISKTD